MNASLAGRSAAFIACRGAVRCPATREHVGEFDSREDLDLGGLSSGQNVTFVVPHADRSYVPGRAGLQRKPAP